jgi:alpha 1,2-mannosyltransferase
MTNTSCDPNVWQAETGQVLINKRARDGMNLAALFVTEAMLRYHNFWFGLSVGDKGEFSRLDYRSLFDEHLSAHHADLFVSFPVNHRRASLLPVNPCF